MTENKVEELDKIIEWSKWKDLISSNLDLEYLLLNRD